MAHTMKHPGRRFYPHRCVTLLLLLASTGPVAGWGSDGLGAGPSAADVKPAVEQAQHEREVPLNSTLNTRDLGGYTGDGGRRVRWGQLYRSDSLANLDEADLLTVQALGLSAITDFRSQSERDAAPDRLPQQSPPLVYKTLAINNPAVDVAALGKRFYAGELSSEELVALTERTSYITDDSLRENWGQWLRSLAQPGALPQLFHCTAGKDRTGFAAALVLLTLGVSKEDVMQDFLLSNTYLAPKIDRYVQQIQSRSAADVDTDILRQVLGVTPASLDGAFQAMEAQYGSIDGFIEQGLGIDAQIRARLQAHLLE